jgi:transcription initiation factor TFIIIB Brf1 subunit/transcription initiation factor TFIIB
MLDYTAEWRSFSDDSIDRCRVGEADAGQLTLRISKVGGSSAMVRTLQQQQQRVPGHSMPEVEKEAANMIEMLTTTMCFTEPMCELAKTMYIDYNEVHRTKATGKRAFQAACAYIASGVNGYTGERRDLDEVSEAFQVDKDATKKCVTQLRDSLAGRSYKNVLFQRSDIMDAMGRHIRNLPMLADDLVRPVINLAEWISATIGSEAAGSSDPIKFGHAVIAIAVIEADGDLDRSALIKELRISPSTMKKHEKTIRKALKMRTKDESSLKVMAANIKSRHANIAGHMRRRG